MNFVRSISISQLSTSGVLFFVFAMSVFLSGCKKDNGPSSAEVMTQKLTSATWKVSSVAVDAVDRTSLFTGLTLKFTSTAYTTTNGHVVWPASGTWVFTNDDATSIRRNDDVVVTLTEVTDTTLKMSLVWSTNTFGPGRVGSISGKHDFVMVK